MTTVRALGRQAKSEILGFSRNPTAAIFTLLFPLIFLLVGAGFRGSNATYKGQNVSYVELFLPMIIAFGIFTANYTNLAMRVTMLRDQGVLKRVRGTPVPTWVYMFGHIATSAVIAVGLTAVLGFGGYFVYGIHPNWSALPAMLVYIVLGAFAFCSMGLALSGLIPNGEAAPAIVQIPGFLQVFLAAAWTTSATGLLWTLLKLLPLTALSDAMHTMFSSTYSGNGFVARDIFALLGWGIVLSIVAVRNFRWENKPGVSRRRSRRSPSSNNNASDSRTTHSAA